MHPTPTHQRIRQARTNLHMGQGELALIAGCSQSAISQYENGRKGVLSSEVVEKICKAVGVDVKYALTPEVEVEDGQTEVLAFCENYDCPAAARRIVRGRLFIQPATYLVWRGPHTVHCPACREPVSYGCTAENGHCLTPLTAGAIFCVGCGNPLVKTPKELEVAEHAEVKAHDMNAARGDYLQAGKPVSLPKPEFRNTRSTKGNDR